MKYEVRLTRQNNEQWADATVRLHTLIPNTHL